MPYLSKYGYQNDIFVSYSQGDVEHSGRSPLKSWSKQAVELLRDNLVILLDPPPSIFIDESSRPAASVDPMMPLTDELAKGVSGAAFLLVLMSPHYLRSRWCARELETWVASLAKKAGPPEGRIAIARVFKTDEQQWPPALQTERVGFTFYDPAETFPYGWQKDWQGVAPNDELSKEMMKLTTVLHRHITALKEELDQRAAQQQEVTVLRDGQAKEIYLHARQGYRDLWDRTSSELAGIGIGVRPGQPEPEDAEENDAMRSRLASIASRCEAMLMVGADPYALDDDLDLIGRDRREYIRSRHKKFLPCAVLDKAGLRTEQRLRAARSRGIDWLDGTQGTWTHGVVTWLKEAAQRAADSYGLRL